MSDIELQALQRRVSELEEQLRQIHSNGHSHSGRTEHAPISQYLEDPYSGGISVSFRNVTEPKQAEQAQRTTEEAQRRTEQALRESETRYRLLTESLPQLVWTCLPDGRCDYLSPQWIAYTGVPAAEQLDLNWLDRVIHPEDRERTREHWFGAVAGHHSYDIEYRIRAADGSYRWFQTRGTPLLHDNGGVLKWFGTCTDIDDRKTAEAQAQRTQALLQLIIDNVPGLVSYLDSETRYRFVNRQYQEWYEQGSLEGRFLREVLGEDAFTRARPYLERALTGEAIAFDDLQPHDKVRTRYVHVSYTPDRDPDGKVSGVVTMVQDVTDQKQMERALLQSQQRLSQVFLEAPVAILVVRGPDFVVELANPAHLALLPVKNVLGRPFAQVVPELRQDVWQAFRQVIETGEPFVRMDFHVPYDQDGDGQIEDHWFNVVYNPLREPDGSVSGLVAVSTEVTAQLLARRELERVNKELEEFAYVASHDLQEPLRMVNVYSQLLVKRFGSGSEQAEEFSHFISQGVTRMEALIGDLLSYSRTVQRNENPVGTADLSLSLTEAVSVLQSRIEECGAVIGAESLPSVRGDTNQMAHVFQNLLSNALKYRRAGVVPNIVISAHTEGDQCIVAVRDNGIGFEQQHAKRIFGLFKRLHREEYPGTGLGLAICQRIVERYGGRMWAEGTLGVGSTFFFSLPALTTE